MLLAICIAAPVQAFEYPWPLFVLSNLVLIVSLYPRAVLRKKSLIGLAILGSA